VCVCVCACVRGLIPAPVLVLAPVLLWGDTVQEDTVQETGGAVSWVTGEAVSWALPAQDNGRPDLKGVPGPGGGPWRRLYLPVQEY
jgi:hypothetical protein